VEFWEARNLDMRSRFSGVKLCQKGGGAGKAAARGLGSWGSSMAFAEEEKLKERKLSLLDKRE
jgi:hypothetical protein